MARYRLRFLLQEVDVHRGVTLIGRSPECHVTIEDPLVSRQHARITIDDLGARVEDLKSRNGVKVNNLPIKGATTITDGDRLRIGTQEMVFCELVEGKPASAAKTTGFLRHCSRCRMPYPQELVACPNCGETAQLEDDTMTGQLGGDTARSWGLQLLLEVVDKALALGRLPDVARALQRVQTHIEERLANGERLDGKQVDEVLRAAVRHALTTREVGFVTWLVRVYPRANLVPSSPAVDALADAAATFRGDMRASLTELAQWLRAATADPETLAQLQRVEQLQRLLDDTNATEADQTTRNPPVLS